jgi:hypothetical protein
MTSASLQEGGGKLHGLPVRSRRFRVWKQPFAERNFEVEPAPPAKNPLAKFHVMF